MRAVIPVLCILSATLLSGSCTGDSRSEPKRVGGCIADTISLDTDFDVSCDEISSPVRISILSVEDAGADTYRKAAAGLAGLLCTLEIDICAAPQLVVIQKGPCWPRYRVDFRLGKGSESRLEEIRSVLSDGMLAGSSPSEERPDGYGLFFVQAGVGSTDRWTIWYARPQR